MGEGLGQPTNPRHTSTSVQPSNEEPITIPSSSQPKKTHRPRKSKRATKISQSSGHLPLVADETITKERKDRMERAATTASRLEAEQGSGNINRTQSMATLNEPSPSGTDKGKGKKVEQEKPINEKGTRSSLNEEITQRFASSDGGELAEEKDLQMQEKKMPDIAEWDNVPSDDGCLIMSKQQGLQEQEQEELTIEERSKLFVELMDKRMKHFARLRVEEQRRKPVTKAQKRN
ncbi:hypothetical protein Tco_0431119 [Tanacetum coccineum]